MRLWLLSENWNSSEIRFYPRCGGRVTNGMTIFDASMAFNASLSGNGPWSDPYPPDFPTPRVEFARRRLPDFNIVQNLRFASDRLREAMALPEDVAQFLPIINESRTPNARAASYSLFHVLSFARAIDGERSDCHVDYPISAKTGMEVLTLSGLSAIRFLPDFEPPSGLFREAGAPEFLFATDALADRVIKAGCTGVHFYHPLWFAPECDLVIKTAEGAARLVWDDDGRDYTLEPFSLKQADLGPAVRPIT